MLSAYLEVSCAWRRPADAMTGSTPDVDTQPTPVSAETCAERASPAVSAPCNVNVSEKLMEMNPSRDQEWLGENDRLVRIGRSLSSRVTPASERYYREGAVSRAHNPRRPP